MFSNKESKKTSGNAAGSKQPNRFGQTTKIQGEIHSQEDFRVDGEFEGTLITSGKLVVGEKGKLTGTIKVGNAEIQGTVSGDLVVDDLLSIKKSARIEGNVKTKKLAIEPGAVFNATCEMETKTASTAKATAK
jgi:cytoskeletal protein CcmA (bactofilin family)